MSEPAHSAPNCRGLALDGDAQERAAGAVLGLPEAVALSRQSEAALGLRMASAEAQWVDGACRWAIDLIVNRPDRWEALAVLYVDRRGVVTHGLNPKNGEVQRLARWRAERAMSP